MRALLVMVLQPRIEIGLSLLQRPRDRLPKARRDRMHCAGSCGIAHRSYGSGGAASWSGCGRWLSRPGTVLGPAVDQDPVQWAVLCLKERRYPIMQERGSRDERLSVIPCRTPDLVVSIDARLLRDAPKRPGRTG